jgi:glycyl-tRNA synthetase
MLLCGQRFAARAFTATSSTRSIRSPSPFIAAAGSRSVSTLSASTADATTEEEKEESSSTTTTTTESQPVVPQVQVQVQPDMEEIVSLCKRRGIIFPSSDIYNGYAGFFDYGPLGSELKKNLKDVWWNHFVTQREDVVGLDSSIIHNPTTWQSSGTFLYMSLRVCVCVLFYYVCFVLLLFVYVCTKMLFR